MYQPENLHIINASSVAGLSTAIDQWLAARREFHKKASDESGYNYNSALFELGAAWAEAHPESAYMPGEFEWFRRSLIAPEFDE